MVGRFLALALLLAAASPLLAANEQALVIRMHGSNTVGSKLGPALLEAFARSRGFQGVARKEVAAQEFAISGRDAAGREFQGAVQAHGTNTGYADLVAGTADLWMASRAASSDEVLGAKSIGELHSAAQEHVIALDGLAIIVHPDNALTELSVERIRDVFAGRINNWAQLGGKSAPIELYGRDEKSGTFDSFKAMVMSDGSAIAGNAQRLESSSELESAVATHPNAIGFVGFSYITRTKALAVSQGDTLPLRPNALTVSTEDYLLARRLYLYSARSESADVRDFVEFVQGMDGQKIVADSGFVAQNVFVTEADPLPGNPDAYYDVIADAERLSLNFRFRPQSSTLDSRALRDIDRLGAFMQLPQNRRKQLRLAGFAIQESTSKVLTQLTVNDRVDFISQLLAAKGVPTQISRGFIGGAPIAPSDRPEQRTRNERVEVWLVNRTTHMSGG